MKSNLGDRLQRNRVMGLSMSLWLAMGSRVRFEINVDAASRAVLKVSSKLLLLATVRGTRELAGSD